MNDAFTDIHEAAKRQAMSDCMSLDENNWEKTAGPGMMGSTMRAEWDAAYSMQQATMVEIKRERLRILSGLRL